MRIHFIAIGGSIMHSLALAMKDLGHHVTGSDDEIYEPSRSRLAEAGLLPAEFGWFPERLSGELDLVVLGMHARADNPELFHALSLGLEVRSFPEVVYMFSANKTRIMVAGSHGKTSTAGMIAYALSAMGIQADRMIGAAIGHLKPVEITSAPYIVLEGDEYLTSPVDSRPKFMHYRPQITVLTGIAWDHMNVFPTYEAYLQSFRGLLRSLTSADILCYCKEDPELARLVQDVNPAASLRPYGTQPYQLQEGTTWLETPEGRIGLQIFGRHNLQNLAGALRAIEAIGGDHRSFYSAISSFTGTQSRLQLLLAQSGLTVYKDFAHAPSKVRATVDAVREKHATDRLIAILELHTFSSLNPEFLPQYAGTLAKADEAIVFYSPHTLAMKKLPALTPALLKAHFADARISVVTTGKAIVERLRSIPVADPTTILWMSSGRFDGLALAEISRIYGASSS